MGLDDLLDSGDSDRPEGAGSRTSNRTSDRSAAVDRRRAAVLATVAVVVTVALGIGVGVAVRTLGDDGPPAAARPTPAATPSTEPTPTPTATPTSAATPTPTPTPTTAAVGDDIGYLVSVTRRPASGEVGATVELRFDRVQFLTGEQGARAAAAMGQEFNDYLVVNDNPRLRTVQVRADATVSGSTQLNSYAGDPSSESRPRTLDELVRFVDTGADRETLFDLTYDRDGFVTAVSERFVP